MTDRPTGPIGRRRLTAIGPFVYDKASPPDIPDNFTEPYVINGLGDTKYWKSWTVQEGANPTDGIAGIYVVDDDIHIVDNRSIRDHVLVWDRLSQESDLIEGDENIVVWACSFFNFNEDVFEVYLDLPQPDSPVNDNVSGNTISPDLIYYIGWICYSLGVPDSTVVNMKHKLVGSSENLIAERKFYIEDVYNQLRFETQISLPDIKVNRDLEYVRPNIEYE